MKILVLAGGLSPERDVSLSSGSLISNALIENGHDVLLVDLYHGLEFDDISNVEFINSKSDKRYSFKIPEVEPDLNALKRESNNGESLIGKNIIELARVADVVFISLHGSIGENGMLQAMLDCYGIKYTGSGYMASLLAMDKDLAKRLMVANNIKTADWNLYYLDDNYRDQDFSNIKYPCVVKPCSNGSSIGVSILDDEKKLMSALEYAKNQESKVLIEDKIEGREFSCGILNGVALPIIEIMPKDGFYDYKNKYQAGFTTEICPAELDEVSTLKIQEAAIAVHRALGLGFYSRIDFILDKTGTPYCLEANTLPGMTPTSLLPQEANAHGIPYNKLCEMIANSVF